MCVAGDGGWEGGNKNIQSRCGQFQGDNHVLSIEHSKTFKVTFYSGMWHTRWWAEVIRQ